MDSGIWGLVGAILGAIVGAGASVVTTVITGRNARILQEDSDSLVRRERAREFQRTNLLELQEHLLGFMRLVGQAHFQDLRSWQANPSSQKRPLLGEELDQELGKATRRLALLIERVADDGLRKQLKQTREHVFSVLDARTPVESEAHYLTAITSFDKTMESIGLALRSYY